MWVGLLVKLFEDRHAEQGRIANPFFGAMGLEGAATAQAPKDNYQVSTVVDFLLGSSL
jgi:hypothetical protein